MKGLMRRGPKSQIAVIITFVIGLSLLFGVVLVNLYKVSNFKLMTANIVDKGALGMCSALGSHANLIIETADSRGSLGFWPFHMPNCDPNWGLILPLAGFITGVILSITGFTFGLPILLFPAFMLGGYSLSATIAEVNAIMKGAASAVVKEMVDYNGIREMSLQAMLSQIQTDPVNVERPNTASTVFTDPDGRTYDLTGSSVLPAIRERLHIPRFVAWYHAVRFPQVNDRPLLVQIDAFITFLTQITRIERWDRNWMMVREISLKVDGLNGVITGTPPWVIDMNSVRALGPVKTDGRIDYTKLINMLSKNQNPGFLSTKFVELTQHLLDQNWETRISYSTKNALAMIPLLGQILLYDHSQIWNVTEDLRGFLIRTMEVLNMPVSERLTTISKWLPAFYNPSADHADLNDGEDIWEITNRTVNMVNSWIQQLQTVYALMKNETVLDKDGFIEVGQAIRILQGLAATLQRIPPAIEALNTAFNQQMNPSANILALRNEAVYGWNSRNWDDVGNPNFQDTYHLVGVRLDRYPHFNQFPYIVQLRSLWSLTKCWKVLGQPSGSMDFSISRYDSDLPSAWWNFRFRRQAGAARFPVGTMSAIVNAIHASGSRVTSDTNGNVSNLLTNYAINSKTRGYYGPNKRQINVERIQ